MKAQGKVSNENALEANYLPWAASYRVAYTIYAWF